MKTLKTKQPAAAATATAQASRTSYACQPSDFKCVSHPHTCIAQHMVCDGIHDCTDHSDEFNCTREQVTYKRWKKHYYQPLNPLNVLNGRTKRKYQQMLHKPWKQNRKNNVPPVHGRRNSGWFQKDLIF